MWKIYGRAEVFINADYFSWILNCVINKLVSHVYQMMQIAIHLQLWLHVPQIVVSQQTGNLCFYRVAAMPFVALFVISASLHSRWTLTLLVPLCSYIVKQRIFVVPHSKSSPTPNTRLRKPPKLEPGWPAPSPASKPDADEKFMTVCLENLTFHLKCCCSSDDAPADGAFSGTDLFLTVGVRFREKEGDVSTLICSSTGIHVSGAGFCSLLPCRCVYVPVNRKAGNARQKKKNKNRINLK